MGPDRQGPDQPDMAASCGGWPAFSASGLLNALRKVWTALRAALFPDSRSVGVHAEKDHSFADRHCRAPRTASRRRRNRRWRAFPMGQAAPKSARQVGGQLPPAPARARAFEEVRIFASPSVCTSLRRNFPSWLQMQFLFEAHERRPSSSSSRLSARLRKGDRSAKSLALARVHGRLRRRRRTAFPSRDSDCRSSGGYAGDGGDLVDAGAGKTLATEYVCRGIEDRHCA